MTANLLSIVNGLVFDGVGPEPVEYPIHTEGGRIVGLEGPPPEAARVIDARGRVVTPGLIDAHLHAYTVSVDLLENEALPMSYVAAKAARRLEATLRRGFTTVRDVAGGDIGLRTAIDEGIIDGPRYLFTGPGLTQTGGHGDARPGHLAIEVLGHHAGEIVDGVDDLRRAVRERFRTGSHAIKIFTSGGVASPTDPLRIRQYSAEEVRAVCDEASRRDSYVAAHAYSPEAIAHSVTNGVRTIEHGNLINEQAAVLMAEHGAYLVPTLIAYDAMGRRGPGLGLSPVSERKNREVLEAGLSSIGIARRAGVRIGLGTDLVGDLEDEQLLEFRNRCEVDTVGDVLRSATSVNASILRRPDLGVIREGAIADLVVLGGNPFERTDVLWSPDRLVIRSGKVVEP
ncbi:MAG: amidohydrolase family protein [bacterium]|nr:amidohydrolase family protein [bacterium]MDE0353919.1 amidohydrolase family protein [bacterium]